MDVESPEVRETIDELISEGPFNWHEGVQLDVLWYGGIDDAVPTPRVESSETEARWSSNSPSPAHPAARQVDWIRPRRRRPVGHKRTLTQVGYDDEEAPQTGRAHLNSDARGYGWDDVAGVHKPAYADGAPAATWSA